MNNVTLSHVDKSYTTYSTDIVLTGQERQSRTRQVLRDLSVTLPEGQITVIVGRSGGHDLHSGGLAQRHAQPRPLCDHMDQRPAERGHGLRRGQDAGGAL